jgi:hypothetical protein
MDVFENDDVVREPVDHAKLAATLTRLGFVLQANSQYRVDPMCYYDMGHLNGYMVGDDQSQVWWKVMKIPEKESWIWIRSLPRRIKVWFLEVKLEYINFTRGRR